MNPYASLPAWTFATPIIQAQGGPFRVMLAPINHPSDDRRVIVDTLGWREPPLPFMSSDSEAGHGDAIHTGNLADFGTETIDGIEWVTAQLTFDTDTEATEFERLATEGKFNGVSIHMGKAEFWPVRLVDGKFTKITYDELEELIDEAQSPEDVDAIFATIYDGAFDAEIAAATQVAIPAFPGAQIEAAEPVAASAEPHECGCGQAVVHASATGGNDDAPIVTAQPWISMVFNNTMDSSGEPWVEPIVAAAALDRPPSEWFADPALTELTPLTVTDEGRIYGHLANWDTCHLGFLDRCVKPRKDTDYSTFLTSRVICADGSRMAVGPLVVDDGHAPKGWGIERVMSYYADTALAAGYVTVGNDEHGVWVAGAVSHKATKDQIETLRRHPLSGDWRSLHGQYRLMAAVSVNSPAYPVPEVLVAAGEPVGLITYGPHDPHPSELALVASALQILSGQVADLRLAFDESEEERERPTVDAEAEALLARL